MHEKSPVPEPICQAINIILRVLCANAYRAVCSGNYSTMSSNCCERGYELLVASFVSIAWRASKLRHPATLSQWREAIFYQQHHQSSCQGSQMCLKDYGSRHSTAFYDKMSAKCTPLCMLLSCWWHMWDLDLENVPLSISIYIWPISELIFSRNESFLPIQKHLKATELSLLLFQ